MELDPANPLREVRVKLARAAAASVPRAAAEAGVRVVVPGHPVFAPSSVKQGARKESNLAKVRHVVAVASGKGGVGKSSVAVNLAAAFAGMGARTGVLDADVHGPSLPTMLVPKEGGKWKVTRSEATGSVEPVFVTVPSLITGAGAGATTTTNTDKTPDSAVLKAMSFGFVSPGTGGKGTRDASSQDWRRGRGPSAAMMRGPMASRTAVQLATHTEWGELDVLVVDLPPGTGDVHLELCQKLSLDAAVVVTTPQELSFVDVARGIDMLEALKVPVVALVENMSWFTCDECDKRHYPFGEGHLDRLANAYGVPHVFSLPLLPALSACGDAGAPFVSSLPSPSRDAAAAKEAFQYLTRAVSHEMVRSAVFRNSMRPRVSYDATSKNIVLHLIDPDSAREVTIPAMEFRKRLRVVEEMLGMKLEDLKPEHCVPTKIEPKGNYAVGISWADGHDVGIYPHDSIIKAAEAFAGES